MPCVPEVTYTLNTFLTVKSTHIFMSFFYVMYIEITKMHTLLATTDLKYKHKLFRAWSTLRRQKDLKLVRANPLTARRGQSGYE